MLIDIDSFLSVLSSFSYIDTATTEIYTLSLHDALPICRGAVVCPSAVPPRGLLVGPGDGYRQFDRRHHRDRSEEHTSELQSHSDIVCRLLLEKKKKSNTVSYRSRLDRACACDDLRLDSA